MKIKMFIDLNDPSLPKEVVEKYKKWQKVEMAVSDDVSIEVKKCK